MLEKVTDVTFLADEPQYTKFEYAIVASKKHALLRQEDSAKMRGQIIVDYAYNGNSLVFVLSGGKFLQISAQVKGVKWDILEPHDLRKSRISPAFHLRFPDLSEYSWRWKKLLDTFLNKRIRHIGEAGETMVVFYVQGCPDLLFSVLVVKQSGERLLFFEEE